MNGFVSCDVDRNMYIKDLKLVLKAEFQAVEEISLKYENHSLFYLYRTVGEHIVHRF